MEQNPYKNNIIEFHILQSFPVTCLNRDDVGAPKTAIVGGVTRARVSSQCWKRQVRMQMRALGSVCGNRTRLLDELVKKECILQGATEEQATLCGKKTAELLGCKDNDVLLFFSSKEISEIVGHYKMAQFDVFSVKEENESESKKKGQKTKDPKSSKFNSIIKEMGKKKLDALDIALFGRMVASNVEINIQAAASFSHAISTHKIGNEIDFFTAVDDRPTKPGAAHLGSLEFNSATYYRYISVDLGQLYQTYSEDMAKGLEDFIKALFLAIPSGRQNTQSGASCWDYAKVFIRKGQRLQVPFTSAVNSKNGDYLQPSIQALESYLNEKEAMSGSLFQKISEYTLGKKETPFNIDQLIEEIKKHVKGIEK